MDSRNGLRLYRCAGHALVRAAVHVESTLPDWPDVPHARTGQVRQWCAWLRKVWAVGPVAEAIEHASPVLARQVEAMLAHPMPEGRSAGRTALSVTRYVLRM